MMLVPTGSAGISGTQSYDLSFVDGSPNSPCFGDVLKNTQNWATVETPANGYSFAGATYVPDRQVLAVFERDFNGNAIMVKEYNFNSSTFNTPQTPIAKSTLTAFSSGRGDITYDLIEQDKYYVHNVAGVLSSVPEPIANGVPVGLTTVFTGIPTGGVGTPGLAFDPTQDSIWIRTGDAFTIREYDMSPGNEGNQLTQATYTHTQNQFFTFGAMFGLTPGAPEFMHYTNQDTGYLWRAKDTGGGFVGLVDQGCGAPTSWATCPSGNGYQTHWRNETGRVIGPTSNVINIGGWPLTTSPFV